VEAPDVAARAALAFADVVVVELEPPHAASPTLASERASTAAAACLELLLMM